MFLRNPKGYKSAKSLNLVINLRYAVSLNPHMKLAPGYPRLIIMYDSFYYLLNYAFTISLIIMRWLRRF